MLSNPRTCEIQKHCSYRHLAETIEKMHKAAETAKSVNVKLELSVVVV
jgi:hypothetical protein